MADRLIVVVIRVFNNGGAPNDLGVRSGVTNQYIGFNKPTRHLARYAAYVADASIAAVATNTNTEFDNYDQAAP